MSERDRGLLCEEEKEVVCCSVQINLKKSRLNIQGVYTTERGKRKLQFHLLLFRHWTRRYPKEVSSVLPSSNWLFQDDGKEECRNTAVLEEKETGYWKVSLSPLYSMHSGIRILNPFSLTHSHSIPHSFTLHTLAHENMHRTCALKPL